MLGYLAPWLVVFWIKSGASNFTLTVLGKLWALWAARNDPARLCVVLVVLVVWGAGLARFAWQLPWTLLAGALGGVLFYCLRRGAADLPEVGGVVFATTFGTPLVMLSYSTVVTLHIGMMKRLVTDQNRDWWARLGGFILLAALAWLGLFAVTLYAAPLVKWLAGLALAGGLAWAATSIGGVLQNKRTHTRSQNKSGNGKAVLNKIVVAAPYVFIVGLAIGLASVLNAVLASPARLCDASV